MQQGHMIQDRYELIEELGRGGMAVVWRARDRRLERDVALKLVAPGVGEDPELLVRVFSEAQSVARISHPNVVSVLDFGDDAGSPFLVMELVSGGSLADLEGRLTPERAVDIVVDAARGAGAAHRAAIVHRDIKPANILLTEEGRAKLADFGIAWAAGSERLTATGAAIGTPSYVSPEQASGASATAASDVYSLGAVLYQLLTGAPPFLGSNPLAVAMAHVELPPPSPAELVADLDPALDALVLRCLAKDPGERFPDGDALAAALTSLELRPGAVGGFAAATGARLRTLSRPAVLVGLAGLLVVGALTAWAVTSGRSEPRARATTDIPQVDYTRRDRRRSPTPTATAAASSAPVTQASPSATPIPSPAASRDDGSEPDPDPSASPSEAPSPAPSEPSPQPSEATPTPVEPSPQPTATGAAADTTTEDGAPDEGGIQPTPSP
jgi:eukaryotic-like serine/threonine-protein kinase